MAKITNQSTLTSSYTLPDYTKKNLTTKSNVSETENMTTSFVKVKSCARTYVVAKDEVEILLNLQNDSPYEISNVQIKDTIGNDATFVAGSVEVDGVSQPTFDIQNSITLPNAIAASSEAEISYRIQIVDEPQTTSVSCVSDVTYEVNGVSLEEQTEAVDLTIETLEISIAKTSDAEVVIAGQELTFQNVIRNEGTVKAEELFFSDPIPAGTTFVENSVKIDDVGMANYNPQTGFRVPDLDVGEQITITFKVTVNE